MSGRKPRRSGSFPPQRKIQGPQFRRKKGSPLSLIAGNAENGCFDVLCPYVPCSDTCSPTVSEEERDLLLLTLLKPEMKLRLHSLIERGFTCEEDLLELVDPRYMRDVQETFLQRQGWNYEEARLAASAPFVPASQAQRDEIAGRVCFVNERSPVTCAHIVPQYICGYCEHPLCVEALCHACHDAYDQRSDERCLLFLHYLQLQFQPRVDEYVEKGFASSAEFLDVMKPSVVPRIQHALTHVSVEDLLRGLAVGWPENPIRRYHREKRIEARKRGW
jgi:hypothetical protein